jgi:hypothetical protein
MKALTFLIFVLYFASIGAADDFTTTDGKEYKNVTIRRVEPDGIVLVTDWGISKVYFAELPKDVQERFAYRMPKASGYVASGQESVSQTQPTKRATEEQSQANPRQIVQSNASKSSTDTAEQTYELTRDYVIGGDTGEVFMRLKRGERYRGTIFGNDARIDINGTSCTVPSNILSAPK